MKALTIRQPWAWAILHAGKDVENRSWPLPPSMLGKRVLIHAAQGCTRAEYDDAKFFIEDRSVLDGTPAQCRVPPLAELPRGAVVGAATLARCEHEDGDFDSPWFVGPYGFVLEHVVALVGEPIPFRGALGFWTVPPEVEEEIRRRRDPDAAVRVSR